MVRMRINLKKFIKKSSPYFLAASLLLETNINPKIQSTVMAQQVLILTDEEREFVKQKADLAANYFVSALNGDRISYERFLNLVGTQFTTASGQRISLSDIPSFWQQVRRSASEELSKTHTLASFWEAAGDRQSSLLDLLNDFNAAAKRIREGEQPRNAFEQAVFRHLRSVNSRDATLESMRSVYEEAFERPISLVNLYRSIYVDLQVGDLAERDVLGQFLLALNRAPPDFRALVEGTGEEESLFKGAIMFFATHDLLFGEQLTLDTESREFFATADLTKLFDFTTDRAQETLRRLQERFGTSLTERRLRSLLADYLKYRGGSLSRDYMEQTYGELFSAITPSITYAFVGSIEYLNRQYSSDPVPLSSYAITYMLEKMWSVDSHYLGDRFFAYVDNRAIPEAVSLETRSEFSSALRASRTRVSQFDRLNSRFELGLDREVEYYNEQLENLETAYNRARTEEERTRILSRLNSLLNRIPTTTQINRAVGLSIQLSSLTLGPAEVGSANFGIVLEHPILRRVLLRHLEKTDKKLYQWIIREGQENISQRIRMLFDIAIEARRLTVAASDSPSNLSQAVNRLKQFFRARGLSWMYSRWVPREFNESGFRRGRDLVYSILSTRRELRREEEEMQFPVLAPWHYAQLAQLSDRLPSRGRNYNVFSGNAGLALLETLEVIAATDSVLATEYLLKIVPAIYAVSLDEDTFVSSIAQFRALFLQTATRTTNPLQRRATILAVFQDIEERLDNEVLGGLGLLEERMRVAREPYGDLQYRHPLLYYVRPPRIFGDRIPFYVVSAQGVQIGFNPQPGRATPSQAVQGDLAIETGARATATSARIAAESSTIVASNLPRGVPEQLRINYRYAAAPVIARTLTNAFSSVVVNYDSWSDIVSLDARGGAYVRELDSTTQTSAQLRTDASTFNQGRFYLFGRLDRSASDSSVSSNYAVQLGTNATRGVMLLPTDELQTHRLRAEIYRSEQSVSSEQVAQEDRWLVETAVRTAKERGHEVYVFIQGATSERQGTENTWERNRAYVVSPEGNIYQMAYEFNSASRSVDLLFAGARHRFGNVDLLASTRLYGNIVDRAQFDGAVVGVQQGNFAMLALTNPLLSFSTDEEGRRAELGYQAAIGTVLGNLDRGNNRFVSIVRYELTQATTASLETAYAWRGRESVQELELVGGMYLSGAGGPSQLGLGYQYQSRTGWGFGAFGGYQNISPRTMTLMESQAAETLDLVKSYLVGGFGWSEDEAEQTGWVLGGELLIHNNDNFGKLLFLHWSRRLNVAVSLEHMPGFTSILDRIDQIYQQYAFRQEGLDYNLLSQDMNRLLNQPNLTRASLGVVLTEDGHPQVYVLGSVEARANFITGGARAGWILGEGASRVVLEGFAQAYSNIPIINRSILFTGGAVSWQPGIAVNVEREELWRVEHLSQRTFIQSINQSSVRKRQFIEALRSMGMEIPKDAEFEISSTPSSSEQPFYVLIYPNRDRYMIRLATTIPDSWREAGYSLGRGIYRVNLENGRVVLSGASSTVLRSVRFWAGAPVVGARGFSLGGAFSLQLDPDLVLFAGAQHTRLDASELNVSQTQPFVTAQFFGTDSNFTLNAWYTQTRGTNIYGSEYYNEDIFSASAELAERGGFLLRGFGDLGRRGWRIAAEVGQRRITDNLEWNVGAYVGQNMPAWYNGGAPHTAVLDPRNIFFLSMPLQEYRGLEVGVAGRLRLNF